MSCTANDLLWEQIADEIDNRIEAGILPVETAAAVSTMSLEEACAVLGWPTEPDADRELKDNEIMQEE